VSKHGGFITLLAPREVTSLKDKQELVASRRRSKVSKHGGFITLLAPREVSYKLTRMPTITIDISYFNKFLNAANPADVMIELFRSGGWVIFLWVFLWGLWKVWVESRQIRWASAVQTSLLAIDVPKQTEQSPKAAEHIFSILHGSMSMYDRIEKYWIGKIQPSFSLEIVSIDGYVQFFIRCWSRYRDLVEAAVYAQYPDAEIAEVADYTENVPKRFPAEGWDLFGTEFTLSADSAYPIRTYPQFEHTLSGELKDPIASLLEGLAKLKPGEQVWVQMVISPNDGKAWRKKGMKIIRKLIKAKEEKKKPGMIGEVVGHVTGILSSTPNAFFGSYAPEKPKKDDPPTLMMHMTPGAKLVVESIEQKLNKEAFALKTRVIYVGKKEAFAKARTISTLKGTFGQYTQLDMNGFSIYGKVTTKSDYPWQRNILFEYLSLFMVRTLTTRQNSILRAYKWRSLGIGCPAKIVNIEELATLFHFPNLLLKTPLLKKTQAKRAEPPFRLPVSAANPYMVPQAPAPKREYPRTTPPPASPPSSGSSPGNLPFI